METNIVGFGVGITDRFRDYVDEKSEKIAHLADRAIAFEVKVSRHNDKAGKPGDDRVELTIIGPGKVARAEAQGADKYVAFDLAIAKLLERVRRAKDRKKAIRGKQRTSLHDASADGFPGIGVQVASADSISGLTTGEIATVDAQAEPDDEYSPVVIREKVFPAEWMTVDEAVDRMELVGHDFFLFVDSKTDRPSVVYRRKGWDYGVIGLDEDASDTRKRA
ncbi:ribosome-associated translation inhibitor RaiA [Okibacterium endophyticum]